MTEIIRIIAVGLLSIFVTAGIKILLSRIKAEQIDNTYFLKMPSLYFFLAILLFAISVIVITGLLSLQDDLIWSLIIWMTGLFFAYGSISCLLLYKNHTAYFDEISITVKNTYGKTSTIKWSEILKVSYNPFTSLITIKSETGKVKLHEHIIGLNTLINRLEERTGWKAKDLKLPL